MLSIITCSIDKEYLYKFITSLERTIDVVYELVVIDNKLENLSISKAYNKGAKLAKFNNFVFVHEDVEFLNGTWASSTVELLSDSRIGIVGVAGSSYLPTSPTAWYLPDEKYNNVFIHQGFKYSGKPQRFDNQGEDLTPVYLLDGVFLAMRKDVFDEFPFNESLGGFHAYDVDICHRVGSKYQNLFTNQIEMFHHSEGVPGKEIDQSYFDLIIECKKSYLNIKYKKRNFEIEFQILKQLFSHLSVYYSRNEVVKMLHPYVKIKNLGLFNFFKIKKIFNS